MGVAFSRFRKEISTYQKLEKLEEKIKNIETYTINTQRKQKRWVGGIRVFSVGFSIIAIIIYYLFFPPTWRDRVIRALPSIISLFIMILSKNLVAWYFERTVSRNSSKLSDLREEKKNLLEKVMETETYKVAVEILNRFGDKPSFKGPQQPPTTPTSTKQLQITSKAPRMVPPQGYVPMSQPLTLQNRMIQSGRLVPIGGSPGGGAMNQSMMNQSMINRTNFNNSVRMSSAGGTPPAPGFIQRYDNMRQGSPGPNLNNSQLAPYNLIRKRTPFPIIDFENKGVFEKIIDRLIGDGPSDRFALICKECHKHNGMALEDEFYYSAFYCIFCNTLNPAKKLRPIAPSLPTLQPSLSSGSGINTNANLQRTYSSSSSSESGDENSANEPKPNDIANQQIQEQQRNIGFSEDILPPKQDEPFIDEQITDEQITVEQTTDDAIATHYGSTDTLQQQPDEEKCDNDEGGEGDNIIRAVNNDEERLVAASAVIINEDHEGDSKLDANNDRIIGEKEPVEKKND